MTVLHTAIVDATTSVAGGRIYPGELPPTPVYPCISYSRVGGSPLTDFDGDLALDNGIYQFDIFAKTIAEAWSVASALRTALGASADFTYHTQSMRDGGIEQETEPDVFHVSVDGSLWG